MISQDQHHRLGKKNRSAAKESNKWYLGLLYRINILVFEIYKNMNTSSLDTSSLGKTLAAVNLGQVSTDRLANPLSKTFDKILNVLSLGIYGAYKNSLASAMKNDLLDIGVALTKWDTTRPDLPVKLTIDNRDYELCDMPEGGVRMTDCETGEAREMENISLASIRDMVMFDMLSHPDFAADMDKRLYETSTTQVDLAGIKQEKANACGEASKNMILSYHGVDHAPATNNRFMLEGIAADDVIQNIQSEGLKPTYVLAESREAYTSAELRKALSHGPLLCELVGHFVVVHGVNEMLDRVDILCPLLGNRSAKLEDLNGHLQWDQDSYQAPLTYYTNTKSPSEGEASTAPGKSLDPDFSPSIVDRLGVAVLKQGYALGNSWLMAPENFSRA